MFYLKKIFIAAVLLFFTQTSYAGLFSEIDILVREAVVDTVKNDYSQQQLDQVFYNITYVVSQWKAPHCHWTLEGKVFLPDQQLNFLACVVADSKESLSVSVLDLFN